MANAVAPMILCGNRLVMRGALRLPRVAAFIRDAMRVSREDEQGDDGDEEGGAKGFQNVRGR